MNLEAACTVNVFLKADNGMRISRLNEKPRFMVLAIATKDCTEMRINPPCDY